MARQVDELSVALVQNKLREGELSTELVNIKAQLSAEVEKQITADERFGIETGSNMEMELGALQSLADQQSSQLNVLKEDLVAAQEHINEMVSKLSEFTHTFRQDLDHEIHLRSGGMESLWDEVNLHKRDLVQESTDREGEDHHLQISMNELREKADMFRVEIEDITRRLWDAIEMHTHDIRIDDLVETDNRAQIPCEQHGLVHPSPPGIPPVTPAATVATALQQTAPQIQLSSQRNAPKVTSARPLMPPVLKPPQFATRVVSSVGNSPTIMRSTVTSFPDRSVNKIGVPTAQKVSASAALE